MSPVHNHDYDPLCHEHEGPDGPIGSCLMFGPATTVETTDPSTVMVISPTGGTKGQKLARFDLIPAEALEQVAEVYGMGSKKYADNNWRKGYAWSLSFAALMRHAWKFWRGETYDPESGLHHMAHVVFHALSLITNTDEHPEYDDRWKRSE